MSINHVTPAGGNVFEDLGFDKDEAAKLKLRSDLAIEVVRHMRDNKMTQTEAAKAFGVTQPEISLINNAKVGKFTIDKLVTMLSRVGLRVNLAVAA